MCQDTWAYVILRWVLQQGKGFEGLVEDCGKDFFMDRIFRGKRVEDIRLVEVVVGDRVVLLPLKPSLQIAEHSPEGFNWGYEGSVPAQLALGILYEVTGNVALSREYYPLFKIDHVSQWSEHWEMRESEVLEWLRDVGAVGTPVFFQVNRYV